jgi:hypothetical protein
MMGVKGVRIETVQRKSFFFGGGGYIAALYEVAEGIAHVHGLEAFIKGWLAKRL